MIPTIRLYEMEARAEKAEAERDVLKAENSRLKEANAALLEGLRELSVWNKTASFHRDYLDMQKYARALLAQYATPEPTEEAKDNE